MASDLSDFMSCTIGDANFQVDALPVFREEPIIKDGIGRVGTTLHAEGEGFLQADNQTDFINSLAVLQGGAFSGVNFQVKGPNGQVEYQILAAQCVENGPHIAIEFVDDGSGPFFRRVKFVVEGKAILSGTTAAVPPDAYKVKIETSQDRLRTITRTGTITGAGSASYFANTTLAGFQQTYSSKFVISYNATQSSDAQGNVSDLSLDYEIKAVELASALPSSSSATIVDGEVTQRQDRDEQMRLTTVWDCDLVLSDGDIAGLISDLLSTLNIDAKDIVRQSATVTRTRQLRLKASFTTIEGGDGNDLMNFSQTVDFEESGDAFEEFKYPGADPIAIKRPTTFTRVTQSGSATGRGRFPQPPNPVWETMEQLPQIKLQYINDFEMQTSWTYRMLIADLNGPQPDASKLAAGIARPSSPAFW